MSPGLGCGLQAFATLIPFTGSSSDEHLKGVVQLMQTPRAVISRMPPISPTSLLELTKDSAFSCSVRLPRGSLEPEVAKAICRRFVVHSLLPKATPRCKKPRIATFRVHIPGSGLSVSSGSAHRLLRSQTELEPSCWKSQVSSFAEVSSHNGVPELAFSAGGSHANLQLSTVHNPEPCKT